MCPMAREIRIEDWPDKATCPNCGRQNVTETAYRIIRGGVLRATRSSLECRDCAAYSTCRVVEEPIEEPMEESWTTW